jgi:hypothetical protein
MKHKYKDGFGIDNPLQSKIRIVKTFDLSQLIYFLQCCEMRERDIIKVENTLLKLLEKKSGSVNDLDRIKRQMLINSCKKGRKAP